MKIENLSARLRPLETGSFGVRRGGVQQGVVMMVVAADIAANANPLCG